MSPRSAYFAYGSNMNAARVAERGLLTVDAIPARLGSHKLVFDKRTQTSSGEAGHANIVFARDCMVEGVLYVLADETQILKMDPFERAPWNYGRDMVMLDTDAGQQWAWTYFANPAIRTAGLSPTRTYLNHLLAGRAFLSDAYFRMLAATPCLEDL